MTDTLESPHPLRAWRESQDLTLRALAARLAERDLAGGGSGAGGAAVSYSILARIEQGRHKPSFDLLLALLEVSGGALALDDWVPAEVRERVERARPAPCRASEGRPAEGAAADPARVIRRGVLA